MSRLNPPLKISLTPFGSVKPIPDRRQIIRIPGHSQRAGAFPYLMNLTGLHLVSVKESLNQGGSETFSYPKCRLSPVLCFVFWLDGKYNQYSMLENSVAGWPSRRNCWPSEEIFSAWRVNSLSASVLIESVPVSVTDPQIAPLLNNIFSLVWKEKWPQ